MQQWIDNKVIPQQPNEEFTRQDAGVALSDTNQI